jgi:hypothetical protein
MKFNKLVANRFRQLIEQTPADLPIPGQEASAPMPAPAGAPAATAPLPEPSQPQGKLTPEGKVWLVGLLKKALFMNPGDKSLSSLDNLPDVNESNASEVLQSILDVMDRYSTNLNIDKLPKT